MSKMRLPPLNALRAFEAAARHNGYIAAAQELSVTRGAISRHVKQLEEHLGVALFRRHARGVDLTEAGRRLQPVLLDAFEKIGREVSRLSDDAGKLRVICPPATSIRWLIPKLDDFRARHPEIDVRLTTDFHGGLRPDVGDYDIAFSLEHWPRDSARFIVEPLFPVLISPACTPDLATGMTHPDDLLRATLLHETQAREDWSAWLSAFPVDGLDPRAGGNDFPNLDLAVRAALMGAGVVMIDVVLCRDELLSGALVVLFPDKLCQGPYGDISLVGSLETWESPKVRAFRAWAKAAAEADVRALQGM